jgi:hypothetical protein
MRKLYALFLVAAVPTVALADTPRGITTRLVCVPVSNSGSQKRELL